MVHKENRQYLLKRQPRGYFKINLKRFYKFEIQTHKLKVNIRKRIDCRLGKTLRRFILNK